VSRVARGAWTGDSLSADTLPAGAGRRIRTGARRGIAYGIHPSRVLKHSEKHRNLRGRPMDRPAEGQSRPRFGQLAGRSVFNIRTDYHPNSILVLTSGGRRGALGRVLRVLQRADFRVLLCTAMHESTSKSRAPARQPGKPGNPGNPGNPATRPAPGTRQHPEVPPHRLSLAAPGSTRQHPAVTRQQTRQTRHPAHPGNPANTRQHPGNPATRPGNTRQPGNQPGLKPWKPSINQ
jgi:hypothetical protein